MSNCKDRLVHAGLPLKSFSKSSSTDVSVLTLHYQLWHFIFCKMPQVHPTSHVWYSVLKAGRKKSTQKIKDRFFPYSTILPSALLEIFLAFEKLHLIKSVSTLLRRKNFGKMWSGKSNSFMRSEALQKEQKIWNRRWEVNADLISYSCILHSKRRVVNSFCNICNFNTLVFS